MAIRSTEAAVKGVLLSDYGKDKDGNLPSLLPFLQSATVLVDRVATCATAKGHTLNSAELELIERWLAAHFYATSDRPAQSSGQGGASATFQGQTGMRLEATHYGQTALSIDTSGCLEALSKRQVASMKWLGKVPSEQINVTDRD